jgi:ferredoxin-NADP reductase
MIARMIESRELAPDVRHFVFDVPELAEVKFQPGQFVSFSHLIREKTITRAYSISSTPDGNRFSLCLNRVADGHMSPHLFDMTPGDTINMKGPIGTFTWRNRERPAILVATGTGIAPFRGMVYDELSQPNSRPITLIFGSRYPAGQLYGDEFRMLATVHPRFTFIPTVTRPDETWTGQTGRVQPLVMEAIGDQRELEVYACGMKEMTEDIRNRMKDLGFDRKQIIVEKYD